VELTADAVSVDNLDLFPSNSPFPMLRIHRSGTLQYANSASRPLLQQWRCNIGDRLPGEWTVLVEKVCAEGTRHDARMQAGESAFLLSVVPLADCDAVQVYGFDDPEKTAVRRKLVEDIKSAQDALRKSETQMRSLQDNLPLGLYRSKPDGRIVYANAAMVRMFGFDNVEQMYRIRTSAFYVDPDQRALILSVLEKHGLVKDWEVRLRRRDGRVIDCALNIRASFDEHGTLVHQDGIISDITERKRIEQALKLAKQKAEEASRIKSNFLATMSHELRTPLNGILGFAALLEESLDDDEQREMAVIINSSGHRLLDTLNSILDLSIVEANKLNINWENVDVVGVIKEVEMLYRVNSARKGLELRSELPSSPLVIVSDERLLRQILSNLLNNAVKYTQAGHITLSVSHALDSRTEDVSVHIEDTGIGISPRDQAIIFDEFRQASEGYSRSYDGSGLGLSVSQKFAHVLGGRITLQSSPGVGSRFTLTLPLRLD
jgi:PAS domain S-box-containing protein